MTPSAGARPGYTTAPTALLFHRLFIKFLKKDLGVPEFSPETGGSTPPVVAAKQPTNEVTWLDRVENSVQFKKITPMYFYS